MAGFTKLFNSILDSSIWSEPDHVRILWITMLAMADRSGEVQAALPGLARRAGITLDQCRDGLEVLMAPDPHSRTKDREGRRVEEITGGWSLINHGLYRKKLSADERREYNRQKQAEYRAKKKAQASKDVNDMSMTVNHNVDNAHSTEAEDRRQKQSSEADTEADTEAEDTKVDGDLAIARSPESLRSSLVDTAETLDYAENPEPKKSPYSADFLEFWQGVPTKIGKGNAWKAWQQALKGGTTAEEITAGLPAFVAYERRRQRQDNGKYKPLHPATWINGSRWEDEIEPDPTASRHTPEQIAAAEARIAARGEPDF